MTGISRRTLMGRAVAGLALAQLPLAARAEAALGVTLAAQGDARLRRAGSEQPLRPDQPLYEGDQARTGAGSFAALHLNTATRINLGPDSSLAIDRFVADMGGQITVGGAMVFDRPDDLPPLDLTVRTAFAQIGVRGTRFFLGPSKGVFAVFVDRGEVTVRALGTTRRLRAGEGVEVRAKGAAPREVVTWGQARIDAAFASVGL